MSNTEAYTPVRANVRGCMSTGMSSWRTAEIVFVRDDATTAYEWAIAHAA